MENKALNFLNHPIVKFPKFMLSVNYVHIFCLQKTTTLSLIGYIRKLQQHLKSIVIYHYYNFVIILLAKQLYN